MPLGPKDTDSTMSLSKEPKMTPHQFLIQNQPPSPTKLQQHLPRAQGDLVSGSSYQLTNQDSVKSRGNRALGKLNFLLNEDDDYSYTVHSSKPVSKESYYTENSYNKSPSPRSEPELVMYYEVSSKTYVHLKPSDALSGLRNMSLVLPAAQRMDDEIYDKSIGRMQKSPLSYVKNRRKRSRGGCLTCRHRKKRCCETKPRCQECIRLNIKCEWPMPGAERKNRTKNIKLEPDEMFHDIYGVIKVLKGVVEYKVEED